MTVTSQTNTVIHAGNGLTTVFPFVFRITEPYMAVVSIQDNATKQILQVLPSSAYSITGVNPQNQGGGNVTYNPPSGPLPIGQSLIITRKVNFTQLLDLVNQGGFFPETIEYALDQIVFQTQQLEGLIDRAVLLPEGEDGITIYPGLPGQIPIFNADGDLVPTPPGSVGVGGDMFKAAYDPLNFNVPIRFVNGNFSMPPSPNNLILYVMKTGDDTVTNSFAKGSTPATAFLTIDAALNFAKKYWAFDGRMTVLELRVGPGKWGNFATGSNLKQGYDSYPFAIFIVAQDAATPANWPDFDIFSIGGFLNKGVYVENVKAGTFGSTRMNIFCVNNVQVKPPIDPTTVTISIASPGVVSWIGHGRAANSQVVFTTTGALPTGLSIDTPYYVINPTTDTFQLSATASGTAINTSGTQSGVHTAHVPVPYSFYSAIKGQLHMFGDINVTTRIYCTSAFIYAQQQGSIGIENGDSPTVFPGFNLIGASNIVSGATGNRLKYRAVYGAFIYSPGPADPGNVYQQLTYAPKFHVDSTSFSSQTTVGVEMKDNAATGGPCVAYAGNATSGYEYFADGRLHKWGQIVINSIAVGRTDNAGVITYSTTIPFSSAPRVESLTVNNANIQAAAVSTATPITTQNISVFNDGSAGQTVTITYSAWGFM